MKKHFFSVVLLITFFIIKNTAFAQNYTSKDSSIQNIYTQKPKLRIYKGCEQKLFIPLEKPLKNIIKISEGEIQKTDNPNIFVVRTNKNTSNINIIIEDDEKPVKKIPINLYPVPAPRVYIGNEKGEEINRGNPINIKKNQKFTLSAKIDESFKILAPKDTNFQIKKIVVSQFRQGKQISNLEINGNVFDTNKINNFAPGDGIQFEIMEVTRTNYKGQEERVSYPTPVQFIYVGLEIER